MKKLYHMIETWWFRWLQQLRFLCVGGFNTLAAYFIFLGLNLYLGYTLALIISYALSINLSIFTMRYYVFRSQNPLLKEYGKAGTVYLGMIACNYGFLWLLIDHWQQPAWLAQALFTALSTAIIYQIHKRITFC